jgi:predicted Zn-dependent protease
MTGRAGLEIAANVVEVVAAAAPVAEAEATVVRTEQALTRFANSAIHQNVADESEIVSLRIHRDGRTVTVSTSAGSAQSAGLEAFVTRALDAARSGPADPGWPGLTPPSDIPPPGEAPPVGPPAQRAAVVRDFVDAADGLETAGYCKETRTEAAFANSAGHTAAAAYSSAAFDGIARSVDGDGVARLATDTLDAIDGVVLGRRAAAKAAATTDAIELPTGRYPVLLEPAAVADLTQWLAVIGFNGKAVNERQSFVNVGGPQFDPAITLVDDAPACGATFDADGTPTARLVLVDAGTTAAVTHDRRTAAEAGARSTGHAFGSGPFGPIAAYLTLDPGAAAGETRDVVDLVAPAAAALLRDVDRGILVSDFWYTRVLDQRALAVTGLTRNGVWLVEHGEITRAVKNLRFTQSYPAALAPGAVRGVGPTAVGCPSGWLGTRWTVPALHLAAWNVTGGASG